MSLTVLSYACQVFCEMSLNWDLFDIFLIIRLGFGVWGSKAAEEVPFSAHHIEGRLPCSSNSKESACNAGDPGSIPGLGRFLGKRNSYPTLVFLPGEFHGQRSLVGYD